ncbi:MAG TPA: nuclear transport factor 2 family protein [Steroidobacteraceae bacterium]|nr:nuclear transport factor 2 family protein [Steroidobacteraceae bacterium]
MSSDINAETQAIRELVERWVIYSDSGDWERFAELWHEDGWMTATWLQAPAQDFVRARREGFERGVQILHFLGGFTCDVVSARAIAQTKMTINQRAAVDGVLCDVVCTGRFYDFLERRAGRWGMVRRQPIYERDRIDPVKPGATLELDAALLASFPEGYRHLAYLQTRSGYSVKRSGLPGLRGPEVERLYAEGRAWLAGSATPGAPL